LPETESAEMEIHKIGLEDRHCRFLRVLVAFVGKVAFPTTFRARITTMLFTAHNTMSESWGSLSIGDLVFRKCKKFFEAFQEL
jgi:hypothetical protein